MNQQKQSVPPQQWHYTLTTNERQKFINLLKHAISQMPNQQYDLTRIHQLAENFERYSFMHSKSKEQYGNSCKQKLLEIKQVIDGNNRRMNEQNNNGNNTNNANNLGVANNNMGAMNYNGNNNSASTANTNINTINNNTNNPGGMNANLNNLSQEQIQSFLARQAQARQQAALRQQQPQQAQQSQPQQQQSQQQFNVNQQQLQQPQNQQTLTPQQQQQARLINDLKSQPIPQPLLAKIPGLPPGVNTWVQIMELAKQQAFTPQVMQQIKQVHNAHNQMLINRVREQTLAAAAANKISIPQQQQQQQQQPQRQQTQQQTPQQQPPPSQQQQQQHQQPINPQQVLQRQQMMNMKINLQQQPQQIQSVPQQQQQQQQQPQQGMVQGQPRMQPQQAANQVLQASSNAQYIKEATAQALQLFKKLQSEGRIAHDIPDEQRQVFIKKFIMSQLELMKKKNAAQVLPQAPQQQQQQHAMNNLQKGNQARLGQGNANISPAQIMLQQQLQLLRQQPPQLQKTATMGLNNYNPVQISPQNQQQPLPTQGRWNTTPQMNQSNLAQFPQQTPQQHFDNQKLPNNPMMPVMPNTQLPTHQMQQRLQQQGLPTSGQNIGNNTLTQQQQKQQQQQQQHTNFRTATTANASAQDKLELKALVEQSANFAVNLRNLTNEMGPNDKKYMNSQMKTLLQMLQITDNVIPSFFFISKNKDATRKLLSMRVMLKIIIEGLRKNEYYANQELYSKIQLQIQKYLTFIRDYNSNNPPAVNQLQQHQPAMPNIQNNQLPPNVPVQVPFNNLQQQQLNNFSSDANNLNNSQMMVPNMQSNEMLSTQLQLQQKIAQQRQQQYQMSPNMGNITPIVPHPQVGPPSLSSSASTTGKKLTPNRRKSKATPKLTKAQQAAADAALLQQQQQQQFQQQQQQQQQPQSVGSVLRSTPSQQPNRVMSAQQVPPGVKNIAALSPAQQQHLKEQADKLAKEESIYELEEASKIKRLQLAQSDPVAFFLTTLSHAFGLNEEESKLVLKNANNLLLNAANKKQLSPSLTRGLTPSAILQTPTPFNVKTPLSQQRKTTPPSPKGKGETSEGDWTGDVKPQALRAAFKEVPAIAKTIINFTILTPPDDDLDKNKDLVKKNIFVNDKKRPIEDDNDFIIVNQDDDDEDEKFDLKKFKIGYYEEEKVSGDSIWDMEF